MALTPEERQEIIFAACEKALLLLPEIVGNLIMSKAGMAKLVADFYQNHPELRKHSLLVSGTIEHVEGQNPGMKYEDILTLALPEIERRVRMASELDLTMLNKLPERHMPQSLVDQGIG